MEAAEFVESADFLGRPRFAPPFDLALAFLLARDFAELAGSDFPLVDFELDFFLVLAALPEAILDALLLVLRLEFVLLVLVDFFALLVFLAVALDFLPVDFFVPAVFLVALLVLRDLEPLAALFPAPPRLDPPLLELDVDFRLLDLVVDFAVVFFFPPLLLVAAELFFAAVLPPVLVRFLARVEDVFFEPPAELDFLVATGFRPRLLVDFFGLAFLVLLALALRRFLVFAARFAESLRRSSFSFSESLLSPSPSAPPVCLFTVAQALFSASSSLTPFSSYPSSMC